MMITDHHAALDDEYDDSLFQQFDDDHFDDPNLYLPAHFITCFDEYQLPVYQAAIAEYTIENPEHRLEIDTSGTWNDYNNPALLCFDRGNLHRFWDIFESKRNKGQELP
jgi:hypothetical protein